MKIHLATSSWPPSAENGEHDAARKTWLTRAKGLGYRFFMGNGTLVSGRHGTENYELRTENCFSERNP
jgi:hypothetical protein